VRKIIALITLYSFAIQAATITDDKLTVGKKASASAKEIVFDTNDGTANKKLSVDKITKKLSATSDEVIVGDGTATDKALTFNRGGSNASIKWDEATAKLKFANDGASFKDLGSGSGGGSSTGVNVLTNASFEDAVGGVISDWTNTGGTLTQQTYTNGVEGDLKYFQFVASGAGQYFEMVKTVPTNFSAGCQVDFKKLNIATDDLFKVEALDVSNNVLASGNVKVSSWVKFPTLSFACPSAGSTFKIRVTSLAAGTLQGDTAYLGSNQNVIQSIYTEDYDWTTVTVTGTWTTNTTYLAKEKRIGDTAYYKISVNTSGAPNATQLFVNLPSGRVIDTAKIPNAVNSLGATDVYKSGSGWNPAGIITYNSTTQLRPYYGIGVGGVTGPLTLGNITQSTPFVFAAGDSVQLNFSVPIVGWSNTINKTQAISNDQSSWFIDANIGGANPSLGTAAQPSYVEIQNSSLDLVINTTKGSASAEIACASGTASSGLNCGGSAESIGIAFIPTTIGPAEACFEFSHLADTLSGGTISSIFQVVETTNTSQAIVNEGGERIHSGISTASSAASSYYPHKVCGTFNFSDLSKKTIRLEYEQAVAGSLNASQLIADRGANTGQRDIHVTVRPLLSAYNRPILTGDQVTTPNISKPKICSFQVNTGNSITKNYGGCAASSTGTTANTVLFTTSYWSAEPNCTCTVVAGGTGGCAVAGQSASSYIFYKTYAGALTDVPVEVFCHGY